MTQAELDRVNAERRRRGQPPLTMSQATSALASRLADSSNASAGDGSILGSFALDYLVGLSGVPLPSAGGLTGYMMREATEPSPSHDSGSPSFSGGGGSFGGGGASSSDSGSSSSSSSDSSSSSSSSDSGSSSDF